MNVHLPFLRARLELDQTLRTREFFARAIRGRLTDEEYRDLICQWAQLAWSVVPDRDRLVELANEDVGPVEALDPCPAVIFARGFVMSLRQQLVKDITLALMGTSWTSEVVERSRQAGRPCRLLAEVGNRALEAYATVQQKVDAGAFDPQVVYALVEGIRGVILGVATYLDTTWRPPTSFVSFGLN